MKASARPPAVATPSDIPTRDLLARLWRDYVRARWPMFALSLLCAAIAAAITTQLTAVLRPAVDGLLVEKDPAALTTIPAIIIGLAIPRVIVQFAQANIVARLGHGVVSQIQNQLFSRLVRADLARLRTTHSGAYVSSVLFDAGLIRSSFTDGVVKYTQHALIVLGLGVWLIMIDPWLGSAVLLVTPVVSFLLRKFSRRARKATRGAMAETSNLSTAVMESLDGVKIVKIENREDFEAERVAEVVRRRQKFLVKGSVTKSTAGPLTELLMAILLAGVLAYAGWRAREGGLSAGSFASFIAALLILGQSTKELANLQTMMAEGFAAARRLFGALDIKPEVDEPASPRTLAPGPCELAFEAVSFSYNPDAPALHDISLKAGPGETVALVGPSGGGKSTILNLVPRFYDAGSGRVSINGIDVRDLSMADLRSRIALVTQEPFLFDDTIRANIAYARPDASDAEIEAAARSAAAHDFIVALTKGYDTGVGEAGARLSGGQRQRIAIARAFLKDAPILLLDEATSALDTESEAKVQEALERLMLGRTTVMIAHRLSTIRNADRIYVIEGGRVVEQGSHGTLLRKGGLYARLARGQNLEETPQVVGAGA